MAEDKLAEQTKRFFESFMGISMAYREFARDKNIPHTSMELLCMVARTKDCTQKLLCEATLLPKQTVNTIITGFFKKGLVSLHEHPADRRTKTISLTRNGQKFISSVLSRVGKAERRALESLSAQERDSLIRMLGTYNAAFRDALFSGR